MAKKRRAARPVAAGARENWIRCAGYQLEMRNSDTSFVFELNVTGGDGSAYQLRVKQLNDRTGLVQHVLHLLAERWPAFDWEFQADSDGSIIAVR